jgi:hypothetical protein
MDAAISGVSSWETVVHDDGLQGRHRLPEIPSRHRAIVFSGVPSGMITDTAQPIDARLSEVSGKVDIIFRFLRKGLADEDCTPDDARGLGTDQHGLHEPANIPLPLAEDKTPGDVVPSPSLLYLAPFVIADVTTWSTWKVFSHLREHAEAPGGVEA